MKKLLTALVLLTSINAFASPAVTYDCLGKDKISGSSVSFELMFSDYDPSVGYTNESITLNQKSWEHLDGSIVFQMYGATSKNHCQKNQHDEIQLNNDIKMTPTKKGDIADYTVSFVSDCKDLKFDVQAYCVFQ